jgi:pimeloyl-ACP methyl ester carboxylesterase
MSAPYSASVLLTRLALLATVTILVGGSGCGDAPAPTGGGADETPTAQTETETEIAAAEPIGTRLRVRAQDGTALRARLAVATRRAPAVIVLHTSNNARAEFDRLAALLHDDGFTVLSLNARFVIHSLREVTATKDERALARDVLGGVAFLRRTDKVRPARFGIVAQSMGAAGAVLAMARKPDGLQAAVALSPPDSTYVLDLQLEDAYAPRGILFVADAAELQNAENLAEDAIGSEVWQAPVDGHGYELLPDARVRERLQGWLDARLRPSG